MKKNKVILRFGVGATMIGALMICGGLAFGHGGEKHDSTVTTETETADTVLISPSVLVDSVLLTIQNEFVTLEPVFEKGCFDCHTTRTKYPWYYKLPFVKGLIDDDIAEAKKHMDMSDGFPFGGHGKPADDLVAIGEEVSEGEMPPTGYSMMHWNASPSQAEKDSIVAWVERSLASLALIGMFPTE